MLVPLDKELTGKEIINVLKSSDSEVLFYAEKYEKYIEEIQKELPNIKYYICFQKEQDDENCLSYSKLMEKGKKEYEGKLKSFDETYINLEENIQIERKNIAQIKTIYNW